ncbi:aldo/keto reductase [Mesorhizobium sp. AR10]|uniref:aldo/keto reductase n=1 Tax=Mesorhizobium sp. AR10 TaxID=2865839 RepID=UPI00215F1A38|nr:aldo/keto reductase [Mesorhizobium sp. AR10]UVK38524.1 aldo/keto reductase [Mesorhizobium sp. AR10]
MAYDIGARVFDRAAAYGAGNAELILGRALKGKDEAVIVTKVGYFGDPETRKIAPEDASAAAIRTSIDNSRQRLQRDCIDVALLHINEYPIERAGEVFDTLGLLRQEGKIGGFGWSTDHRERLAAYAPREGFVAVESDFNVFTPANQLMAVAACEDAAAHFGKTGIRVRGRSIT